MYVTEVSTEVRLQALIDHDSRKSNIQDVVHSLFISSDPVISHISFGKLKKINKYTPRNVTFI